MNKAIGVRLDISFYEHDLVDEQKTVVHKILIENKHQTVPRYHAVIYPLYLLPNTKYQNTHEFNLSTSLTNNFF